MTGIEQVLGIEKDQRYRLNKKSDAIKRLIPKSLWKSIKYASSKLRFMFSYDVSGLVGIESKVFEFVSNNSISIEAFTALILKSGKHIADEGILIDDYFKLISDKNKPNNNQLLSDRIEITYMDDSIKILTMNEWDRLRDGVLKNTRYKTIKHISGDEIKKIG